MVPTSLLSLSSSVHLQGGHTVKQKKAQDITIPSLVKDPGLVVTLIPCFMVHIIYNAFNFSCSY